MCWYSAEHSRQQLLEAEVGERLCVRQMHGYARWVVKEEDAQKHSPRPVCMLNGTSVLFRPSEADQAAHGIDPEVEAVFRMVSHPKRDLFEWPDGKQIEVNSLPVGIVFDVMTVPGGQPAPEIFVADEEEEPAEDLVAAGDRSEGWLARVRRLF